LGTYCIANCSQYSNRLASSKPYFLNYSHQPRGRGRFAELNEVTFWVWHQARKWKYRIKAAIRLKPAAKFPSTMAL
jgi:hypothetical protein